MIEFRHGGRHARLEAGDTHTSEVGRTYRDTPEMALRAVLSGIKSGTPWREAVKLRYAKDNPWLARIVTDPSRDLFFRQNPPAPASRILDIGAGWGQLSLPFARAGHEVTSLEPTPERLEFIRAAAAQEGLAGRIHYLQGDFLEFEFSTNFDLIACIGVLEWIPRFREGDPRSLQVEFLRRANSALKPGGSLVIGIENRLGLKYLLGARDDHLGVPGIAVLDYDLADAKWRALRGEPLRSLIHSRAELSNLLAEAGLRLTAHHAAFPDYKLPQAILEAGPTVDRFFLDGHFVSEHDGIDGSALPFQEELRSHYRSLAALGIASDFAPSFYLVAQSDSET